MDNDEKIIAGFAGITGVSCFVLVFIPLVILIILFGIGMLKAV